MNKEEIIRKIENIFVEIFVVYGIFFMFLTLILTIIGVLK